MDDQAADRLGASDLLLLAAVLCFVAFALLDPLLGFSLFGSDSGEYYRLTSLLLSQGHLPVGLAFSPGGYTGWGYAYPDFPGLFLVAGAGSAALGIDSFTALTVLVPALVALGVLPLFLLFRRLYANDTIAVLGAAIASVSMPRLFSLAHPAPLALGDLFVVAGLWMFVEGRRDLRWYAPLALTGAALIVTHHLSSYFFLLSALGSLVFLELWRPRSWSLRFPTRELVFLGGFASGMIVYWFSYARDFAGVLETGSIPRSLTGNPAPFVALAVLGLVLVGLLLRWRRTTGALHRLRVRPPSERRMVRDMGIIAGAIVAGLSVLLVVPLPSTTQEITPASFLWFAPFIGLIALAGGSRRLLTMTRLGPLAIAWILALGLSALGALATQNPVILPSRHAEYLVIPLGIMLAAVLGYLALKVRAVGGRRALLAFGTGVAVLVAANAVIAYPPPADLGGFQEGYTNGDAALWMWGGIALPPGTVVATDHPLSSVLFGFDGWSATWEGGTNFTMLFLGNASEWPRAATALRSVDAPHCPYRYPAQTVAIDGTMYTGVALDPAAPALPLSPAAKAWFAQAPFVPLYENGPQAIYWIDGPLGSTGTPDHC
jgi:hypothetical protein